MKTATLPRWYPGKNSCRANSNLRTKSGSLIATGRSAGPILPEPRPIFGG
jgi:hypothetical protein